ncbi:MAG: hypothetical protein H6656_20135 [Ardenticatenaceae bacterium]|nr:hypothetical protein [Ardenticatenaceae bacterium]
MVVLSISFLLFGILGYESSLLGIRGLIVGAGIFLTYASIAIAINENEIWFQDNKLIIKYVPVPWYSRVNKVKLGNIKRIVLTIRSNGRNPTIPCIDMEMKNGKTQKFIVASNVEEAKEIIAEMNQALRNWQTKSL